MECAREDLILPTHRSASVVSGNSVEAMGHRGFTRIEQRHVKGRNIHANQNHSRSKENDKGHSEAKSQCTHRFLHDMGLQKWLQTKSQREFLCENDEFSCQGIHRNRQDV